jgi:hypothetical protein
MNCNHEQLKAMDYRDLNSIHCPIGKQLFNNIGFCPITKSCMWINHMSIHKGMFVLCSWRLVFNLLFVELVDDM